MSTGEEKVLGLFAKWPEAGKVKTRLAALRGEAWAAEVAHAFLGDALFRFRDIDARRVVAFAPIEAHDSFSRMTEEDYDLVPQSDGDLGRRLATFFETCFKQGASRVVVIGTDSPTLPLSHIDDAFKMLQERDVVLGPATDGGYYLLGCRGYHPSLFEDINWSTTEVLGQTVTRIRDSGLSLGLLPPWYDVDTPEEWAMFRGHLNAMRQAGDDQQAPRTAALCD